MELPATTLPEMYHGVLCYKSRVELFDGLERLLLCEALLIDKRVDECAKVFFQLFQKETGYHLTSYKATEINIEVLKNFFDTYKPFIVDCFLSREEMEEEISILERMAFVLDTIFQGRFGFCLNDIQEKKKYVGYKVFIDTESFEYLDVLKTFAKFINTAENRPSSLSIYNVSNFLKILEELIKYNIPIRRLDLRGFTLSSLEQSALHCFFI